jgi:hypothetical protein
LLDLSKRNPTPSSTAPPTNVRQEESQTPVLSAQARNSTKVALIPRRHDSVCLKGDGSDAQIHPPDIDPE